MSPSNPFRSGLLIGMAGGGHLMEAAQLLGLDEAISVTEYIQVLSNTLLRAGGGEVE